MHDWSVTRNLVSEKSNQLDLWTNNSERNALWNEYLRLKLSPNLLICVESTQFDRLRFILPGYSLVLRNTIASVIELFMSRNYQPDLIVIASSLENGVSGHELVNRLYSSFNHLRSIPSIILLGSKLESINSNVAYLKHTAIDDVIVNYINLYFDGQATNLFNQCFAKKAIKSTSKSA